MGTSTFSFSSPWSWLAVACALSAAVILVWFILWRPALGGWVRLALLLGLGVFPIAAATSANVAQFETMQTRTFCGSCHVMEPWANDAADPTSTSLPARHSRNASFGARSCYGCHSDYGMYGTLTTKLGGAKHVWHYYGTFKDMPLAEAVPKIHIYKPFPNATCIHCHSTQTQGWEAVEDHRGLASEVRDEIISCTSEGCHGPAHPFSKSKVTHAAR